MSHFLFKQHKYNTKRHNRNYFSDIFVLWTLYFPCTLLLAELKLAASEEILLKQRDAANFTHINWPHYRGQSVTVLLAPIINHSGIPFEQKDEDVTDFEHGPIPLSVNQLFASLVSSSRYFTTAGDSSDYQFQLRINRFQLPYEYSADGGWWETLLGGAQRMVSSDKGANISVSLEITSHRKSIPLWLKEISVLITGCELNNNPQALTSDLNQDKLISAYLRSSSGQAFVAASNHLILQAIHFINSYGPTAQVEKIDENQILLTTKNAVFTLGERLPLYRNPSSNNELDLDRPRQPAGVVQVIKAFDNQAVAYPVNLSAKSILGGDWVRMARVHDYPAPQSVFVPVNRCGGNFSTRANTVATR